jgi:predicted PurR-regulated permease PerM
MVDDRRPLPLQAVLLAAALVAAGLLFTELITLLVAVLATIVVAIPLAACARTLQRFRIPRPLGAFAGVLIGIGIVAGVLAIVIPAFVEEAKRFADAVPAILDSLRDAIHDVTGAESGEVTERAEVFLQRYLENPGLLIDPITSIGSGIAGILAGLIVAIVTAYYMAVRPEPLVRGFVRLFPPARRDSALALMSEVRDAWVGWLKGVGIDMVVTGTLLYVALRLVGLEFALVFAVLTAVLVVVPYFGAIVGGIPPVLYALTISPGKALVVLFVYLLVQQIESNVILPLVMSKTVRLHPAVVALGVVVVGSLFGFFGLFMAVPILSLVTISVRRLWVEPLEERADAAEQERKAALSTPP